MMATQPQLMHLALVEKDVVYTPDDVARDVVNFFKPTGKILEPCAGDGAFLRYLPPDTEWCEIERGRDFFAYHDKVDWIVGNPPFSVFCEWLRHSFEIADNVAYIVPIGRVLGIYPVFEIVRDYGGIRTLFLLGRGSDIGLPFGYAVGSFHFQRGYHGGMFTVFRDNTTTNHD